MRLRKDPPHAHAGDLHRGGLAGALAGAGPGALRGRRRDGRGGRAHLGGRRARGGAGAARPRGADGRAARRGAARQRRQHRPGAAGRGRQDAPARRGGIGHDQRHHALCRLPRGAAVPGRGHGALHGRLRILRFPGPAGRHEDHLRGHAPGSGALLAGDPLQRAAEHGGRGPGRHAGQAHGPAGLEAERHRHGRILLRGHCRNDARGRGASASGTPRASAAARARPSPSSRRGSSSPGWPCR